MKKFWLGAMAGSTALCLSMVLSGCDDDSGTKASKNLVTVKDLVDSIVCNNDADASIKEVNDDTFKIMCGADSVGYASTDEYSSCNINIHDDELGLDLICDNKVVGKVNFKQETSSSSEKVESSSSKEKVSSSSEEPESSSSSEEAESSSSKKDKSSSSVKSSSSEKPSSSSSEEDLSSSSEVPFVFPDTVDAVADLPKCTQEYDGRKVYVKGQASDFYKCERETWRHLAFCVWDDQEYDPSVYFCGADNKVYPLCASKEYNPKTHFCGGDKLFSKEEAEPCVEILWPDCVGCGPDTLITDGAKKGLEYCEEGRAVAYPKCGTEIYDSAKEFCDARDNQVYGFVKIGEQTWMSENLNYYDEENPNFVFTYNGKVVDELTHCGGKNCNVYGRLYTWTAAMDIDAYDYMTGREVYADTVAHQGICPEGWHIPRMSEAEPLIASVKSGKQLCKDYGASKYETCDNETGFSAVGAGVYRVGATAAEDPYKAVDESAAFWLANNKLATGGTTKFLASDFYIQMPWGVLQSEDDGYHTDGLSVRCVKD